jgi:cytosine/adenosine deaminase-related metal-dependent hydrolase
MDPAIGDLARGDIVVTNGGSAGRRQSDCRGAVIDGTNFIAMPGLVNCMDHMWTSVFKAWSATTRK